MSFLDLFGSTNGDDASLLLDNRSCTDHIPINGAAIDDVEESNQNLADASGDNDHKGNPRKRKRKYHRHTPYQIQELESAFKENAHPDEKQRLELRRKLNLESTQIKFWYQNRRTQMKTQSERHENLILKQQNDMLRIENNAIKEATRNPICSECGGGELSSEDHQHLLTENARLKDELNRLYAYKFLASPPLVGPFPGPVMPPNSNMELGVERNGLGGFGPVDGVALLMGHHSGMGVPNSLQQWDLQAGR